VRVFACVVTSVSEFAHVLRVFQRGHVTLLVRVGDMARVGDGCGGERVGIGVGERGGGLISPFLIHALELSELECLVVVVFARVVPVCAVAFVLGYFLVVSVYLPLVLHPFV
jgi:hypothetical protein